MSVEPKLRAGIFLASLLGGERTIRGRCVSYGQLHPAVSRREAQRQARGLGGQGGNRRNYVATHPNGNNRVDRQSWQKHLETVFIGTCTPVAIRWSNVEDERGGEVQGADVQITHPPLPTAPAVSTIDPKNTRPNMHFQNFSTVAVVALASLMSCMSRTESPTSLPISSCSNCFHCVNCFRF